MVGTFGRYAAPNLSRRGARLNEAQILGYYVLYYRPSRLSLLLFPGHKSFSIKGDIFNLLSMGCFHHVINGIENIERMKNETIQ
jgi:hypothetical protein